VNIVLVTSGVLEALGVPPFAGRELSAVDQIPNGAKERHAQLWILAMALPWAF
jgi:hypothetical protein